MQQSQAMDRRKQQKLSEHKTTRITAISFQN
jgi:hypothetical protein